MSSQTEASMAVHRRVATAAVGAALAALLVRLVESLGLDVTYWTDIDLDRHPERLLAHRALVSLGQDEYWSTGMRRGPEAGRARRSTSPSWAPTPSTGTSGCGPSRPGRTGRGQLQALSVTDDPARRTDPAQVITDWRRPPLNDPESQPLGAEYECNPTRAAGVVVQPSSWLFAGTGVRAGSRLPGLVGDEYDRVRPGCRGRLGSRCWCTRRSAARGASFADTRPDAPITLTYQEFADGLDRLQAVGFPMEWSRQEAWRHSAAGVNYEAAAYLLADRLVAVPAPWSGERPCLHLRAEQLVEPVRPRHRSPDDPEAAPLCSHRGPSGGSPTAAKPAAPCS